MLRKAVFCSAINAKACSLSIVFLFRFLLGRIAKQGVIELLQILIEKLREFFKRNLLRIIIQIDMICVFDK